MTQQKNPPHIVVIGAGFGGLWAVEELAKEPVKVTLIDKQNYHTFLPLLYQVAASELEPSQIAYPVRTALRNNQNAEFLLASVEEVDVQKQLVYTSRGTVAYDYLVLATGSVSTFFGIAGAEEYGFQLKTMAQGIGLRNHILRQFELASQTDDPEERRRRMTFVVVGAGATGTEYAGALTELIQRPLARDFPNLNINEARVILVEGADRVLTMMPENLSHYAHERLEKMGVEIQLNSFVSAVEPDRVQLKSGDTIFSYTTVWTAGVKGEGVGERSGLQVAKNGRLPVSNTLQLVDHPQVYVVGDLAAFTEEDGRELPMVAPVAIQQGEAAAQNILRQIQGEPLKAFSYFDKGQMSTIGRNAAVVQVGRFTFKGFIAWIVWLGVHLLYLMGFHNRLTVLINWAWSYIFFERVVRFIMPGQQGDAYGHHYQTATTSQTDRTGRT